MKILAISGSLRKASCNTGLLRACIAIKHPELEFQWADISQFPMFNEDLEAHTPEVVLKVKEQIKNVDGILFAVSQNNFNVSAPLKNAYDWLSRGDTPIKGKAGGLISVGADKGGLRAQIAFRQTVEYCKLQLLKQPQICIKRYSGNYFDAQGNLIDENIKGELKQYLNHFAKWIKQHKN